MKVLVILGGMSSGIIISTLIMALTSSKNTAVKVKTLE